MVALALLPFLIGVQVQLPWLPDAPQPAPHARVTHRTKRAMHQRVLTVTREHEERAQRLAAAQRSAIEAAKQFKVVVKPSPKKVTKVVQTVTLSFRTSQDHPANGLKVAIEYLDLEGKVGGVSEFTTDAEGTFNLKITKFPTVIRTRLEKDGWSIITPSRTVVALQGNEGSLLASIFTEDSRALRFASRAVRAQTGQSNSKVQVITVRRAYSLPPITVEPTKISLIATSTPGTSVLMGEQLLGKTDANGSLDVQIPTEKYPDNGELVFRHEDNGVTLEGTATVPLRNLYEPVRVAAPTLKLVSIGNLTVPGLDIETSGPLIGKSISQVFGKAEIVSSDPRRKQGTEFAASEGTEWWTYPKRGLAFRIRKVRVEGQQGKQDVVERLRITSEAGGNIAGLHPGSPKVDIETKLGKAEPGFTIKEGTTLSYLDGGIVVKADDDKVSWIELRRPLGLIRAGFDDSPLDDVTRVYLSPVDGSWPEFPDANTILSGRIQSLAGVQFTTKPEDADLCLDIQLRDFKQDMGKLAGLVPDRISDKLSLQYRIYETGSTPPDWKLVRGEAVADYRKDVQNGALLFGALELMTGVVKDAGTRELIQLVIGISAVSAAENTRRVVSHAKDRIGPLALSNALNSIVEDLSVATDVRVRITDVDARSEHLTLNAGSKQGIAVGSLFSLNNAADSAFDSVISVFKERQILARAIDVTDYSTTCELVRIDHSVDGKARESDNVVVLQRKMAKNSVDDSILSLLDPTTGLVWGRRVLRLP